MSLSKEWFPNLSAENFVDKASPKVAGTVGYAARIATEPARVLMMRLNARNPQTDADEPEGALAVMKDKAFAMLTLRKGKGRRSWLLRNRTHPPFQRTLPLAA